MIVRRFLHSQLPEDLPHVRLDRLGTQEEACTDAFVRATFGYEGEHLALALGELVEPAGGPRAVDEPGDDRRIDDALALVETAERIGQHGEIRDPLLEQVADASWMLLDEPHRITGIEVMGKDEHADL